MNETPLSEMSDEQIVAEIQMLRERRAQARERRIVERAEKDAPRKRKGPDEVGGDLGGLLDDIFADTEESP